jgi:hypothetical protein
MLTKEILFDSLKNMPERFTLDEVMQRMYVLNKIESAKEKSKAGKTYSTTEAKKMLSKWLKSSGTKTQ